MCAVGLSHERSARWLWLGWINGIDELVENITEVTLEDLGLFFGDRHLLWEVVSDGPDGNVVL